MRDTDWCCLYYFSRRRRAQPLMLATSAFGNANQKKSDFQKCRASALPHEVNKHNRYLNCQLKKKKKKKGKKHTIDLPCVLKALMLGQFYPLLSKLIKHNMIVTFSFYFTASKGLLNLAFQTEKENL